MTNITAIAFLLAVLLVACPPPPAAAQRLVNDTLTDALVLSGGGARGLAHGGVLVGLERLGRDPGLVVGASMGAVVGALYAAGYDPDAVWRIIAEEDWPALFTAAPLLLGPERRPSYPLLVLGTGDTPGGLVPDWRINRRLVHLLFEAQARARGDFDRLARRYRAVAADLRTGERVVLDRGDLALAARASLAVPGVFAPVRPNGRWLVDGGIRDNLPVAVARAEGGERILAVDVIRPPPEIEENDPVSIGLRGLRLLIENASPGPAPDDVVLVPAIPPEFPEALFPRDPVPLLRAGLDVVLDSLGPPVPRPAAPRRLPPPPDSLDGLLIEGGDPAIRGLVRRVFDDVAPGPFASDAVLSAVDRLYATGLFTGVWPSVLPAAPADSGPKPATAPVAPRLRIQVETTERTLLAGAVGYDNDRGGRAWAVLRRRVSLGAPTVLGIAVSGHRLERWAAVSARRHAVEPAPLVWSAGGDYREVDVRRFVDGDVVGETEVRRAGGWAGAELRRVTPEAVAALVVRAEHIAIEGGRDGGAWGPLLRLAGVERPTRVVGSADRLELEARLGAFDYSRGRLAGSLDGGVGALRVALVADLALARGEAPPDALPALGDERLMPGLEWGEGRGRTRTVGGLDVAYPIPLEGFARLRLRAGAIDDAVSRPGDEDFVLGGAELGALWPTPVGSLLVAVGAATDGNWRLLVNVGPEF